jgi:transcriptional regulator with XRE-family HTH domain
MTDEQVGQAIQLLREDAGKTQQEIADALGISRTAVSYAESGRFDQISAETLRQIKETVGFTPEYEHLLDKVSRLSPAQLARLMEMIDEEERRYARAIECPCTSCQQTQPGSDSGCAGVPAATPAGTIGG